MTRQTSYDSISKEHYQDDYHDGDVLHDHLNNNNKKKKDLNNRIYQSTSIHDHHGNSWSNKNNRQQRDYHDVRGDSDDDDDDLDDDTVMISNNNNSRQQQEHEHEQQQQQKGQSTMTIMSKNVGGRDGAILQNSNNDINTRKNASPASNTSTRTTMATTTTLAGASSNVEDGDSSRTKKKITSTMMMTTVRSQHDRDDDEIERRRRRPRGEQRQYPYQSSLSWKEYETSNMWSSSSGGNGSNGNGSGSGNNSNHGGTTTARTGVLKKELIMSSREQSWVGRIAIFAAVLAFTLCGVSLIVSLSRIWWGPYNNRGNIIPSSSSSYWGGDNTDSTTSGTVDTSGSGTESTTNPTAILPSLDELYKQSQEIALALYDEYGRYIIEDYDTQTPFSDFLPGLAGYYGKPLWAMYMNRGQGITSFGYQSKNYPIMEYHTSNIAYQNIPFVGFRTFLQIWSKTKEPPESSEATEDGHSDRRRQQRHRRQRQTRKEEERLGKRSPLMIVEPFSALTTDYYSSGNEADSATSSGRQRQQRTLPKRYMYVGTNEMQIREIDHNAGLETNVTYYTLPEEDFGSFVKRTTITNIDSEQRYITLSLLDGLAQIVPAGGEGNMNYMLKNIGQTLQRYMGVYQPYDDTISMPFYKLTTTTTMRAGDSDDAKQRQQPSSAGHWCLSVLETDNVDDGQRGSPMSTKLLPIIFDPNKVFGEDTTLINPVSLYRKPIGDIIHEKQYGFAKTPSAFAAIDEITLAPGQSITISTYFGYADHILDVPVISRRLLQTGFSQLKVIRSREIIKQITDSITIRTSNSLFDKHVQQMLLDNSMRGGIPNLLGNIDDQAKMNNADEDSRLKVYHLFSRTRGDLELDYNNFQLNPTFFSESPGTFRDIILNRRNDVILNPKIGSFNIKMFLSFIQIDGYQPHIIESVYFQIDDYKICENIALQSIGEADGHRAQREALIGILYNQPFRLGKLFQLMDEHNIELIVTSRQDFIDEVAAAANIYPSARSSSTSSDNRQQHDLGGNDHWTYYMDLIQSYLAIYPDWEERIMYETSLPYFFSSLYIKPRSEKYVLIPGTDDYWHPSVVRQTDPVVVVDNYVGREQEERDYGQTASEYDIIRSTWQHEDEEEDQQATPTGGKERKKKIFKSSAIAKLLLLATLKFATRDPYGMGIEYEIERGWPDGGGSGDGFSSDVDDMVMIGSGMTGTYELVVLLRYIRTTVSKNKNRDIVVPVELVELMNIIGMALDALSTKKGEMALQHLKNATTTTTTSLVVPQPLFEYWDTVSTAREIYRMKTKYTVSGDTISLISSVVIEMIDRWLSELNESIERAMKFGFRSTTTTKGSDDENTNVDAGISPTYFAYSATEWAKDGKLNEDGYPFVIAKGMKLILSPLFLEGPTRMMKTVIFDNDDDINNNNTRRNQKQLHALDIYNLVRSSTLRDTELNMYTMSSTKSGQKYSFFGQHEQFGGGYPSSSSSSWNDNQFIWVHMTYKFYLELLRHDLYDEFYHEMLSGGILPYMNSTKYGRSLLECSSYIVSSMFNDPTMHGRGYLSRWSDSTTEFLSIYSLMIMGPKPFYIDDETKELRMQLIPAIPRWMFQDPTATAVASPEKMPSSSSSLPTITYTLFGSIHVTYYHNLGNDQHLFHIKPSRYVVVLRDGITYNIPGSSIPADIADKIRRVVFVASIDVHFE